MNPIKKAIWRIESALSDDLSLESIAVHAGMSRFYLARAFVATTGFSVMGYVRARRLSKAAQMLSSGADDILSVALDAGYGSHEAFTRAFRDRFGQTPESVRAGRSLAHLSLVEPLPMHDMNKIDLAPPRFVDGEAMLFAGFSQRFHCEQKQGITALWGRFGPHIDAVPRKVGADAYGVVANSDDAGNFEYFAAVTVSSFDDLPADYARLRVAPQRYAVFLHTAHITSIAATISAIWSEWMPNSAFEPADAPVIEVYPPSFDPMTGMGGVEIWIPIKAPN